MKLTPKQSAAAACFLDGLKGKEAAEAMGINRKAMNRRLEALKFKLRAFTHAELAQRLRAMQ